MIDEAEFGGGGAASGGYCEFVLVLHRFKDPIMARSQTRYRTMKIRSNDLDMDEGEYPFMLPVCLKVTNKKAVWQVIGRPERPAANNFAQQQGNNQM